jgi:hypothetical protein
MNADNIRKNIEYAKHWGVGSEFDHWLPLIHRRLSASIGG